MQMEALSVKVKPCAHCHKTKPFDEFRIRKNSENNICYTCDRIYMRAYQKLRRAQCVVKNTGKKRCLGCKKVLAMNCFPIDKTYKSGRFSRCKACAKLQKKALPGYYINVRVGYANQGGSCSLTRKEKIGKHKLTTTGIRIILKKQRCRCIYCGVKLDSKNLTLDHRIPLSRNGKNAVDNIDCTCYDCNVLKHARTKSEFKAFLKRYLSRIQAYQCEPKAVTKKMARGRD